MKPHELTILSYVSIGAVLIGVAAYRYRKQGAAKAIGFGALMIFDPILGLLVLLAWPIVLLLILLRYAAAKWAVDGREPESPSDNQLPCPSPSVPPPPPTSR